VQQTWRGQQDDIIPWGLNSDINYVSDPLLLRELLDPAMGDPLARFTTSRVALSGALGEYVTGSVGGEYNQAMIDPQETLLQRLPTFNVGAQRSFRPFGFNPYGVKLNTQVMANSVNFSRDEGFDGWRHDISPSVAIPFHYENYFDSQLSLTNRQTFYEMSNTMDPNSDQDREFNTDRSVYLLSYNTQTAVERVYDLEPGNALTYLTSLGSESQLYRLERVKHSITPFVNLLYIPQEQQINNPLYDSFDRIGERKLVTYGFRTALLGRFLPPGGVGSEDIPELTPRVQDVDLFGGAASGIPDFGNARMFGNDRNISTRDGEIREVMYLAMRQSYDLAEAQNDRDKSRESLSDLYTEIGVSPTRYFSVWGGNNFNTWRATATSWDMGASFRDDRGDVFALRYQYNGPQYDINTMSFAENPNLDQVEGNIELVLSEQVRLGYYARFDSIKSDLQASRAALRFSDSCKCWAFDVGYGEQQNPDRQFFNVGLSLFGLGMIQQRFGINQQSGAAP
jgi:lipopolysaccharide assembly outer membrane protein LptD (OstA)